MKLVKKDSEMNPDDVYNKALTFYVNKQFDQAKPLFDSLGKYKNSSSLSNKCIEEIQNGQKYLLAKKQYNQGNYYLAYSSFNNILSYSDSVEYYKKSENMVEQIYQKGLTQFKDGKYEDAAKTFQSIKGYRDSSIKYRAAVDKIPPKQSIPTSTQYFPNTSTSNPYSTNKGEHDIESSALAIWSLIFGIVGFGIVGMSLGSLGLKEYRSKGKRALCIIGICLSAFWIVFEIIVLVDLFNDFTY